MPEPIRIHVGKLMAGKRRVEKISSEMFGSYYSQVLCRSWKFSILYYAYSPLLWPARSRLSIFQSTFLRQNFLTPKFFDANFLCQKHFLRQNYFRPKIKISVKTIGVKISFHIFPNSGTKAFSEPESKAHRDHQTALPNKLAYLTYHSYSQFIIYPYSSSYAAEAHNKAELHELAGKMSNKIKNVNGKQYNYGEGKGQK